MQKELTKTKFAPAERADYDQLTRQSELIIQDKSFLKVADSVSQMILVLNHQRQIVYCNDNFLSFINEKNPKEILGMRPGEILTCIHASGNSLGCGTTEFCRYCGAVRAILDSVNGMRSVKECRILTVNNDAFDFRIITTPYNIESNEFIIFVIENISNEKRRQTLERVFFHDILNSAGGISGLSSILGDLTDIDQIYEFAKMINRSSEHLINEINAQRQLLAAEEGELQLNFKDTNSVVLLKEIQELYASHEVSSGKTIQIDKNALDFNIETDPVLLRRIIGNMVKNAVEASLTEGTVTLNALRHNSKYIFSVHNSTTIDKAAQLQLFKRSFSTKGSARGIGTYSMKLLGEKYLKGKVWFESSEIKGTTFFFQLP